MITKNLIVNQLPEFHNANTKPIRGLATFVQSENIIGNIKVFNIDEDLLPVTMAIKIGEQKFVFPNISNPQNYDFKISSAGNDEKITLLIATNAGGVVNGLAMAHSLNCEVERDYSALFDDTASEVETIIDKEVASDSLVDFSPENQPEMRDSAPAENPSARAPTKNSAAAPAEVSTETPAPKSTADFAENSARKLASKPNMPAFDEPNTLSGFYQSSTLSSFGEPDDLVESEDDLEPTGNFYALIQPQLDELFSRFPHFRELEDLVTNTEWVKVNYAQNDSQHYILGKLYDGKVVTHLCYGIPADSRASAPPENLTEYCQWLPLNLDEPDGQGYWVMYQSAETGENIKL